MSSKLHVGPLGVEHLDQLMEIELQSFSHPWSRDSYRHEIMANPLAHYFGCFIGKQLAAYAGFWLIIDEGHITNVAVSPAFRRQHLGSLLVQHIMNACFALGGRWMTLEVRESNLAALSLYQQAGFEEKGRRKNYYNHPQEDAIIMWRQLGDVENKE